VSPRVSDRAAEKIGQPATGSAAAVRRPLNGNVSADGERLSHLTPLDYLAGLVWLVGFSFEAVGYWQLARQGQSG